VELSNTAVVAHELEPRAFKSIRKKYDDWNEQRKASKDKKKEKEDGKTGSGSAAAPEEFELMSPPAKYTGPVPRGMEQDPELSVWVSANGFDIDPPSYTLHLSLVLA
jgi:hypothetical protein